jgi:hypothetical protein
MIKRTLVVISVDVDLIRELALKSGEHIIELESVSGQVDPSGVGGKQSQSLTGPETV